MLPSHCGIQAYGVRWAPYFRARELWEPRDWAQFDKSWQPKASAACPHPQIPLQIQNWGRSPFFRREAMPHAIAGCRKRVSVPNFGPRAWELAAAPLPEMTAQHIISSLCGGEARRADMRRDARNVPGMLRRDAATVLAIVWLLFPGPVSVLCIAPGGHVAVESINSACCASSVTNLPGENQADNGFAPARGCHDCTDLLLAPHEGETVPRRCDDAALRFPAAAQLRHHIPADASIAPDRAATIGESHRPIPIVEPIPLRC